MLDVANLIKIRRDLHQIPELGFQEHKTQAYLLNFIQALPQTHLSVKKWKTGILVKVKGTNSSMLVAYRADIDGLPIEEETGLEFQSKHEGYMHACGHDLHMTIALATLEAMAKQPPENDVLFVFQPAEEGPGGALPMMQSEEFKEWWPDLIFALHIAPELPVGTISSKPGLLFANTSELFIDFKGKGGHAAYPHLTKDMVVAASGFVGELQTIVSRRVDPLESAVITIGKITGGTVQNVIAERARLEGTIRTLSPDLIPIIKQEIDSLKRGFEEMYDCSISIDFGANYYQVFNQSDLVDQFKHIVESSELEWKEAPAAMTGEDFGYMVRDIPGFMFWLGVDSPYGLHHSKLTAKEEAIPIAAKLVEKTLREMKSLNA
ncbi:N-acetyldiaminopimelate deacetylase [Radiobacillus kanasensis]|uniref:N-acetyldiaminopimelate deacetylase n=1 Tax=Radiobacillus kanasensis TaxID=2844358 RepID=UPI001E34AEB3|nr:N-acetyldiaminopimelate deacetylase [Radiobacillus kanasensis]UFU00873.1 N-acetyldiaminopimelate deacetylase [Radiobacillus kanasensis]